MIGDHQEAIIASTIRDHHCPFTVTPSVTIRDHHCPFTVTPSVTIRDHHL